MTDGNPNGPGTVVTLPADEAAFLTSRGFLQSEPPVLAASAAVPNPAGVGGQNANVQGAVYRR